MIQGATPWRVPIFVCYKSWLCCRLANIFNLQNESFCIYFYQGNICFKKIINLVSFIINLVEYLVINSYSVTVLDNFRKETSDRAKQLSFLEVFNNLTFILGNPRPPTSMGRHLGRRFDEGITLAVWITTSLQVRELCSCFTAAWHSLLIIIIVSEFYKLLCEMQIKNYKQNTQTKFW